ncbi:MAG: PhoH family protein [Bdellovibrionales bacterium]|nr:PhoH family protein [Bdellovibrionales bacterium]
MTETPKSSAKKRNGAPVGATVSMNLSISDPEILLKLGGEQLKNLKTVERELEVKVSQDSSGIKIEGQDTEVELAHDVLSQLQELLQQGEQLYPGDIERAIRLLSSNRRRKLSDLLREHVTIAGRKRTITPKTFKQKEYIEAIQQNDIVFGIGPAGTGKTYLAMAMAVAALMSHEVKRVVLCRPAVEAGEKLGFLPGDMAEKVNPYLRPLYDALHDMVDFDHAHDLVERGQIEVAPLAFMRGRTLSKAFVILDEAQNTTQVQMKMLLTRLGRDSKCVVTGDITQIDLPRGVKSGLSEALDILKNINGIGTVRFSEEDVIRHQLVSRIIAAYNNHEKNLRGDESK